MFAYKLSVEDYFAETVIKIVLWYEKMRENSRQLLIQEHNK